MGRRNHRNRWKLTLIRNIRPLWPRLVAGLAAIVVFSTVYSMILPAAAITGEEASLEAGFFLDGSEKSPGGSEENSQTTEITVESPQEGDSAGEVIEGPPEGWEAIPESEQQTVSEENVSAAGESETVDSGSPGSITVPSEDQQTITDDADSGDGAGTEVTDTNRGSSGGTEGDAITDGNSDGSEGAGTEENNIEDISEEETADAENLTDEEKLEEELSDEELLDEEPEEELEEEEKTEKEIVFSSGKLRFRGNNYSVTIEYDADAKIPDKAELRVRELKEDSEEYKAHYETAKSNAEENGAQVRTARFFDITIVAREKGGDTDAEEAWHEIEPAAPVKVNIAFDKEQLELPEKTEVEILHFEDENNAETVEKEKVEVETSEDGDGTAVSGIGFDADAFSVFGVVGTTFEKNVLASDGHNYKITVTCGPESGIPWDADLSVIEVTDGSTVNGKTYDEYVAGAENALGIEEGSAGYIRLFDIKIVDKDDPDTKYQPADGTSVNVKIELADAEGRNDLNVVHFADSKEEGEKVDTTTETADAGQTVEFEADGFSVYAVVDGSTEVNARMKLEFYSNNSLIATLYVKNGDELLGDGERDPYKQYIEDIINDPGVGVLGSGEVFAGWILDKNNEYTTADIDDAMTIEQIRQWAADQEITEGDTHSTHRFDAAICKLYKITYKDDDENKTVLGIASVPVKSSEYGTAAVSSTVSMAYSPKDDVHNFEGWKLDEGSDANVTSAIPADRIYANDSTIEIKGDISFTVNAPAGNWLIFDENGKGGTYNAPQFVKHEETTSEPRPDSEMTRNGYTFGGWYDTKEHADAHGANPSVTTGEFTFGNELNQKTTLYASWIPNTTAPYTVILWGQNTDRTAYEVLGSYVTNGTVGQNIPYTVVENGDEDYVTGVGTDNGHYTGFSLKDSDRNQQVTITPEGDAVLNLHYDRILYNFKFYLYRNGTQNNRYDYANNSGNGSDLNGLVTWHQNQTQHPSVNGYTIQSETVGGRTYYYFVMSAYYGEDISSKWPTYDKITGANNREAVSYVMMVGTKLKPTATNQGSGTVKGLITVLNENILGATNNANGNYVIIRFPDNYYNWRYHIWFETVDGEDYTGKTLHTYNGKTYYEETVLTVRSSNTTDTNQNEPKYQGFDYVTRMGQNNQGVWGGGHWTTGNNPTLYHLNYIYNRQKFTISYFDGNYVNGNGDTIQNRATHLLHESEEIAQGAVIPDPDRNYVPALPEGEEGYVFEGWYLDEGCTTPYTWGTMPVDGIKVYAKWRQVEYRVFLHPNAGTDPTLDWGAENVSTSFRVPYGGKVSTPTGKRENSGYEFVGWYTDPSLGSQYLYNADTELNNETVTTEYSKTEDTELDKWGNVKPGEAGNKDAQENRYWITKKLDLYAKWRKILDGAGINVVYTADDGKGNVGSNPPEDPVTYPDQADSSAQAACTPPNGMYFKYWVVQKWDETEGEGKYVDTEVTLNPGEQFNVNEELARKEPAEGGGFKYTIQLRAEYGQPSDTQQTHIWWFDNYSADGAERHNSSLQYENIAVNEAQNIKDAPTRTGYTFLGWARIPKERSESASGNPPTGKVLDLTEDDLYLKYEKGQFKLNDSTSDDHGKAVSKVAADEKLHYHDMYAVWKKNTYIVTIKKVVQDTDTSGTFTIAYSFDDSTLQPGDVSLEHNGSQELQAEIPYGTVITVSEDAKGYDAAYSAERTTDAAGTALPEPVSVSALEDGSGSFKVEGNTTVTVTNTPKAMEINVLKVDKTDPTKPLTGAKFKLEKYDSEGHQVIKTWDETEVGQDGKLQFTGLTVGKYKLVETQCPAGYVLTSASPEFEIVADAVSGDLSVEFTETDMVTYTQDTKLFTVKNEPGVALPSTGGPGTRIFTILGGMLIALAGALLLQKRRFL